MKRQILFSLLIILAIQTLPAAGQIIPVPDRRHPTIQSAITDSVDGDVIELKPNPIGTFSGHVYNGTYTGHDNIDLDTEGKAITIRSMIDPDNPNWAVINATIIDCQGSEARNGSHRAFLINSGEGPDTKIIGLTIINGFVHGGKAADGAITPNPALSSGPGGWNPDIVGGDPEEGDPRAWFGSQGVGGSYGGAIYCIATSPTIKYCVISNCTTAGAVGGDGAIGLDGEWIWRDDSDSNQIILGGQWGGHGGWGFGDGHGGAIACLTADNQGPGGAASSPIISDCIFRDNIARGGIGGRGGNGGNARRDDPPAWDGEYGGAGSGGGGSGEGRGGAIYYWSNASGATGINRPLVTNCVFSNNIATEGLGGEPGEIGRGSAITEPPEPPDGFEGSSSGSLAVIAGGAAYVDQKSDANFVNCTFNNNSAHGAHEEFDDVLNVWNTVIDYARGGALYVTEGRVVTLNKTNFIDNFSGAVSCDAGCRVKIFGDPDNKCLFFGNSGTSAGAVSVASRLQGNKIGTLEAENCIFGGNSGVYGSGGALVSQGDVKLTNCTFGNNSAGTFGGAIDLYSTDNIKLFIEANDCSFIANQAEFGGGFSADNFDANFTNCYFINNTADSGGGLDLVGGDITIVGGSITGNKATAGDGGGINCDSPNSRVDIRDCTITANSAESISSTGGSGGAINFSGAASNMHSVFNCLITGNSATASGGGLYCWNSTPSIMDCTFSDDTADGNGGAILYDFNPGGGTLNVFNSIFTNCNSYAIYEEAGSGSAIISHSLFFSNTGGDYFETGNNSIEINNQYDTDPSNRPDPLFVNGPLGGFYLSQTAAGQGTNSPALNAGDQQAALLFDPDKYTTRTDEAPDIGVVDLGYHHYLSSDVTNVPEFTLTTSVVGDHGTIEPAGGEHFVGTVVTLTATPDSGWRIKAWSGTDNDASTDNTNTVTMNSDKNVTVEFEQPRTLYVGIDLEYIRIQDAIEDASDGDTIIVQSGTWAGLPILLDKSITLRSEFPDDPSRTILDGAAYNAEILAIGSNADSGTVVEGFTFQNSSLSHVDADDGDDIRRNGGDGMPREGGAIFIESDASPVIKNCIIRDNQILGGHAGPGLIAGEFNNAGRGGWGGWARGAGVYCDVASRPTFINCQIIDNLVRGGDGGNGGDAEAQGGEANYGGNWSWPFGYNLDIVLGGQWVDHDLWKEWRRTFRFNEMIEGQDWGPYIGDFRWYSGYGGGVYCQTDTEVTFINCTINGNSAYGGQSGLGGLTGGQRLPPSNNYELPSYGGGVYCGANSTINFTDCTITNNLASDPNGSSYYITEYLGYGGGVCAEDTAKVEFTNCLFQENTSTVGGGLYWSDSNAITISNSDFVSNTSFQGGGLAGIDGQVTIIGCSITNNRAESPDPNLAVLGRGGGLRCVTMSADVIDCEISGNFASSSGGGVFFGGGTQTGEENMSSLSNCLLASNQAGQDGGGISTNVFALLDISNCTIADNTVSGGVFPGKYGGGLYSSDGANVDVINSVIWGNSADFGPQIAINQCPATVSVNYSDVEGGAVNIFLGSADCVLNGYDPNEPDLITNLPGASDDNPLFVWGDLGERGGAGAYFLSQPYTETDTGSAESSGQNMMFSQQEIIITTTGSQAPIYVQGEVVPPQIAQEGQLIQPLTAESGSLINMNIFRADPQFSGIDGSGYSIVIIDTGIDLDHPYFGPDTNGDGVADRIVYHHDFADNDSDASDTDDHGSNVASIAASQDATNMGMAPGADIIALKVFHNGEEPSGKFSFIEQALQWVVSNVETYNIVSVNMSLSDQENWTTTESRYGLGDELDVLKAMGVIVVCASGNSFFTFNSQQGVAYPSSDSASLSIGAVYDADTGNWPYLSGAEAFSSGPDRITPFSQRHSTLTDIFAPGAVIKGANQSGSTVNMHGTSQASPHIAGIVALAQQLAENTLGRRLGVAEFADLLSSTSVTINDGDDEDDNVTNTGLDFGRVDMHALANEIDPSVQLGMSPCVNAGPEDPDAQSLGMYKHTTRTDGVIDGLDPDPDSDPNKVGDPNVDFGYHFVLTTDLIGDFDYDGDVDGEDNALFYLFWLQDGCTFPDFCHGRDLNYDGIVNFIDWAIFAEHWMDTETMAPWPNPMTWASAPASSGETSIAMRATTASDNSGSSIEYYFDCVYGQDQDQGCSPSGWIPNATYVDVNLPIGEKFGYRVRARDDSNSIPNDGTGEKGNKTDWSFIGYAITGEDTLAPSPDPMTWSTVPFATSSQSISMIATPASDSSGVQYFFECVTDSTFSSGWRSSTSYEATGLVALTEYGFRVKARDMSNNQNETGPSSTAFATTLEEGPGPDLTPPTPDPMTWADPAFEATLDSITLFAATAVDDTTGPNVEYYFENADLPQDNSGWINAPVVIHVGLDSGTTYRYRVRARDTSPNRNETEWSSILSATTLSQDITPPNPNPSQWAAAATNWVGSGRPNEINLGGTFRHIMEAEAASDAETGGNDPVQYQFECTAGLGTSSGWQSSPIYDYAVGPFSRTASYRVRTKDAAGNVGSWSTELSTNPF